ncbi:MAG: DUF4038 domain-containing protein, partial [Candidatus Symbiothrix sp.]|nr:DUF4038 domain-containing protein [Candidatus Symbiothrix sp.]
MRKLQFIIAGLFLLTTLVYAQDEEKKVALPWDNGKLQVSENHRFLQHENGNPFFWLGETAWLLPSRLNQDEAGYFIGETAKNGYNVIQISV